MWHNAIIFQWNVVPPKHVSSLVLHDEAVCGQSEMFFLQVPTIIMFEWHVYSQVKWLENAGAVRRVGELAHPLGNMCCLGMSSTLVHRK